MSKTILITGTSSGFGKLTAITLANKGHRVIAGMRDVNSRNAAVARELAGIPQVEVVELNVTSEDSVNKAVQYTLKKYDQIDVLVNNAGIVGFGLLEATSIETIKGIFDVNLFGFIRGYQAVLPSMREKRSGLIINVSSGLGIFSAPFAVPYIMTKFAIEALAEGIRSEIKEFGIETISVLPGPFPTEIASKGGFGADRQSIIDAYGADKQRSFEDFAGIMEGKIEEYQSDPQLVADGILKLIEMEKGTRPFQTAINPIAEEIEQAYADAKLPAKINWMEKMGWGAY